MASQYSESDTTPSLPPIIDTSTGLEVFDKAESEINSHFTWLHQILNDKNKAMLDKLRERRAEFVELEKARVGQIEEIETLRQQLINLGVKSNESNLQREQTLTSYDVALDKLRNIQPQKVIFEMFADKLRTLISLMDVEFVEDYNDRSNPILSIHRDSIIQSINAFKLKESGVAKGCTKDKEKKEILKVNLLELAFDSLTNRIFAINGECNDILVFQQDGTLFACFEEKFKNLGELSIDSKNRCLYVFEKENYLYKFDLETYQLVTKKDNEGKKFKMNCLDVHNNEIYVGSPDKDVHVFSSELEHIRSFSTSTILMVDILCCDEEMLIYSIFPNELNTYSYNGDFKRNIPLSFVFGMKEIEMLAEMGTKIFSMQFKIDKYGLILFTNPFENCLQIQTFDGHLVNKIKILPQEEDTTVISGVVSTNEGRIFVSVSNSEYPLRCY